MGINRGVFGVHKGSVRGAFIRSLLVTKFGELIWTALQIETWCHHSINFMVIVTVVGFDINLSVVRLSESIGSLSIVCEDSESVGSLIVIELIWKALQIWRADYGR